MNEIDERAWELYRQEANLAHPILLKSIAKKCYQAVYIFLKEKEEHDRGSKETLETFIYTCKQKNKKIKAIKAICEHNNCGVLPAKTVIDHYWRTSKLDMTLLCEKDKEDK